MDKIECRTALQFLLCVAKDLLPGRIYIAQISRYELTDAREVRCERKEAITLRLRFELVHGFIEPACKRSFFKLPQSLSLLLDLFGPLEQFNEHRHLAAQYLRNDGTEDIIHRAKLITARDLVF